MKRAVRLLVPIAAVAVPLAMSTGSAFAAGSSQYQATLNPLNHSTGSGTVTISLNGDSATVNESWSGLAATFGGGAYPHVQHIHIEGQGTCPSPSADKNGDGIVDTVEGQPSYGKIGATLSVSGDTSPAAATNIKTAPGGGSTNYHRTIALDSATASALRNGTAVVVVHGLDPSTLSKKAQGEKSNLVPSLPLAATSPALCGVLTAMPTGGAATGYDGSTPGSSDTALLGAGGALIALGAGGAMFASRRRRTVGAH